MALPTKSEVSTLDYIDWSLPVVYVEAKTFSSASTVSPNVYINVSGTWKLAEISTAMPRGLPGYQLSVSQSVSPSISQSVSQSVSQ